MTTLLNIPAIAAASEVAFNQRHEEVSITNTKRENWEIAFEAGFMRALTVLGMGHTSLSHVQIEHVATTFMAASGEDYAKDPEARPHAWVLQAMHAVASVYENADTTDALMAVIERAVVERDEVVTISLKPLPPLRMGNYQHVIDVRPFNAQTPPGPWADRQTPDDGSVHTSLDAK